MIRAIELQALGFVALAAALSACGPGDGSMLDERGRALAHPYAPGIGSKVGAIVFEPTYQDIAQKFFGQLCTQCHAGSSAAKGLDLTEEHAYEMLIEAQSAQRPDMARVVPRRPDESYLLVKLEGGPGMAGRQMPRNRPARPDLEIDVIRAWIEQGAPR